MILGSHNSWSYLPVTKWWMKPIAFMARCQSVDIKTQYELGARCFDLRIRYGNDAHICVAHGVVEYSIETKEFENDLVWLDAQGDCCVRVLHEARTRRQYSQGSVMAFQRFCYHLESTYMGIKFFCGKNLYNWCTDFDFRNYPTVEENYASVSCKWLAWWPWLYARLYNKTIRAKETDKEILLIDYVNI